MVDLSAAYEGVEGVANFPTEEALRNYRAMALERSVQQADFIGRRFSGAGSVAEACCGNGRLLIALADRMQRLQGFDLAASRIDFARQWVEAAGCKNVDVWRDDMLEPSRRPAPADLGICITGAFAYFGALSGEHERRAVASLGAMVRPGGGLLLELYQHPATIAHCLAEPDGRWQRWSELAAEDPFRFSLSAFAYDRQRGVLRHEKKFIARNGSVDEGRVEALRIYSPETLDGLLAPWFDQPEWYGDWAGNAFAPDSKHMIVSFRRRAD
ncbi:class I SAM-dependent methyltransferase [Ferrovibrio sp.]|uniref:class I SAM-dependent methyltransferase n=1 Tax=Ferrovibrio sp. TaxID=1917215 RepID=UPI000CC08C82|nr:class I SAM-dependent methyltransferase [Ferrovibrio sp.]PJI41892.1 MAG: hypothetical protein CTR53_05390 [Ferrovibrio sp.]